MSSQYSNRDLEKDRDLLANLHAQNLDVRSVPKHDSEWIVKSHRSIMGKKIEENPMYTEDVTNVLGADIKEIAVRAAQLIRSEFAGVEVITPDTRKPVQMASGRIIEINTTPGLGPHFDLSHDLNVWNPVVVVLRSILASD